MTTATMPTSNKRPINLKRDTVFTRLRPDEDTGIRPTMTLKAGERVFYSSVDEGGYTVHIATTTQNGFTWEARERRPKGQQSPAPISLPDVQVPSPPVAPAVVQTAPSAPLSQTVAHAVKETELATGSAVANVVNRHVSGADAMERRVNELKNVAEALKGDVWMVVYDIPDSLKELAPNPSNVFRRHGFRLNLSCWVMPQSGLDSDAVQAEFRRWESIPTQAQTVNGLPGYAIYRGVKYYCVKYAPDQLATIRRIAADMLQEELIRIHTSLIAGIDAADKALAAAEAAFGERANQGDHPTEKEQAGATNARNGKIRQALRFAHECFTAALEAAEAFDQSDCLADLMRGVRATIAARASAFDAEMQAIGRKGAELDI